MVLFQLVQTNGSFPATTKSKETALSKQRLPARSERTVGCSGVAGRKFNPLPPLQLHVPGHAQKEHPRCRPFYFNESEAQGQTGGASERTVRVRGSRQGAADGGRGEAARGRLRGGLDFAPGRRLSGHRSGVGVERRGEGAEGHRAGRRGTSFSVSLGQKLMGPLIPHFFLY